MNKIKTSKGRPLTAETYQQIKMLTDMIGNNTKIANAIGCSVATARRVRNSVDYVDHRTKAEDYRASRQKATAIMTNHHAPIAEPVFENAMQDNVLLRIAVAMERLADAWETEPKRKGLFGK